MDFSPSIPLGKKETFKEVRVKGSTRESRDLCKNNNLEYLKINFYQRVERSALWAGNLAGPVVPDCVLRGRATTTACY